MKKIILSVLFMAAAMPGAAQAAPLKVVTTTTTFADLVRRVGGEGVEVAAVAPSHFNVHFIQPRPSDVRRVARADLFVHAGLDLEAWVDPLLEAAGRPELFRGGGRNLDLSSGVPLRKVPEHEPSREHGDMHLYGNPHYHLDPRNARIAAASIAAKLSALDPSGADGYARRLAEFERALDAKLAEWKALCAHCAGKEIFAFHDDVEYLADFLGVRALQFFEPKPGVPPSPKHLQFLRQYAREHGVKVLAMATYYERPPAEAFAATAGLRVVSVGQNAGELPGTEDVLAFYETNVRAIAENV